MSTYRHISDIDVVRRCFPNVEVKEGEDCDMIEGQTGPTIIIEGWIDLFPRKTVYDISVERILRGVRYYKDGSGQPDEVDFEDIAQNLNLHDAIVKAHEIMIQNNLDEIFQELTMEQWEREEEDSIMEIEDTKDEMKFD